MIVYLTKTGDCPESDLRAVPWLAAGRPPHTEFFDLAQIKPQRPGPPFSLFHTVLALSPRNDVSCPSCTPAAMGSAGILWRPPVVEDTSVTCTMIGTKPSTSSGLAVFPLFGLLETPSRTLEDRRPRKTRSEDGPYGCSS
jgi:hypothetical protein